MLETWRGPQVEEIPKGSGKEKIFAVRRRQESKAFGKLPEREHTQPCHKVKTLCRLSMIQRIFIFLVLGQSTSPS